jgi:hypothetical protein
MLPLAIRLAALVPILAGLGGILFGAAFLGEPAGPATDSHLRYLSGLLLALGLTAMWCAGDLHARAGLFGLLCGMVILGGVGRACGWIMEGPPPWPHALALAMELAVTPALWWASCEATTAPQR